MGEAALYDESAPLLDVFAPVLGIELSYEKTPEILKLAECATNDVHKANTVVKNHYQRIRPFATFKEPSLKPWTDEDEAAVYDLQGRRVYGAPATPGLYISGGRVQTHR